MKLSNITQRNWPFALIWILLISACSFNGDTAPASTLKSQAFPTTTTYTSAPSSTLQPSQTAAQTSKTPTIPGETTSPPAQETLDEPGFSLGDSRVRGIDNALEIYIPEGEFLMGCDPQHNGGFPCHFDELPLHPVYLSAYFIDAYEVTNFQYRLCVKSGNCQEPVYKNSYSRDSYYDNPDYDLYPVVGITWYEAQAYCQLVGGRLPTEAEWEKSARGTTARAYPWGDDDPNCDLANSYDNTSGEHCIGDTAPVGSYPAGASPYGLYDMAGNVWEWVGDWYSTNYYASSPYENPTGKDTGLDKVIRGGSWSYSWSKLRVAYNSNHHPNQRNLNFGFRCVIPID